MKKFKNYKECINYLFGLERVGIKYDLKNIKEILKFIGNPEKKIKSIHIAGTNGKGSVAAIINSVLIESGYKTGLYTSPHIIDFRERILINGKLIPENFVIKFTEKLYDLVEKIKPSFFEATTAMAFEYFAKEKVDYAVIEAGLGGRLDSTNVLKPLVSIITGISIDHTEYLGDTIEKIAFEKAGIVKRNTPCILGNVKSKVKKIISNKCKEKNSSLFISENLSSVKTVKRNENYLIVKTAFNGKNILLKYPVIGDYQVQNIKTALTALSEIEKFEKIIFTKEKLQAGFENIKLHSKFFGRFEKISDKPKIIIDVSHNAEGIRNIKNNLKYIKYKNLYVIFGMMKDKEYDKCLRELEKLDATIILTKPDYKRAEEPEVLYKSVSKKEKFLIAENVKTAYKNANRILKKNDMILVTGSFFLLSDFLKLKTFSTLT